MVRGWVDRRARSHKLRVGVGVGNRGLSTLNSSIGIQVQTSVETSRRGGEGMGKGGLVPSHCLLPRQKGGRWNIGFQRRAPPQITVNIPAYLVSLDKPSPAKENIHVRSGVEADGKQVSDGGGSSSRLLSLYIRG